MAFSFNKSNKLKLTEEQWDFLIQNTDLNHFNIFGWNSLMKILFNNDQECVLSKKQWLYLIENSNLLSRERVDSVLGLVINNKPDLIETVFEKAVNDKNFNLDNYKHDRHYENICQMFEIYKIKQSINNGVASKIAKNNKI